MTKQSREPLMADFRHLYGYGPEDTYCGSCSKYQEHSISRLIRATGKRETEKYPICTLTLIGRERRYDGDPPEWEEGVKACSRYERKK